MTAIQLVIKISACKMNKVNGHIWRAKERAGLKEVNQTKELILSFILRKVVETLSLLNVLILYAVTPTDMLVMLGCPPGRSKH